MWVKPTNRPDASQISTEIGAFRGEGKKKKNDHWTWDRRRKNVKPLKRNKMLAGEKQSNQSRKRAYITAIA